MTLVACRECGAEVSDRAPACPKCGARAPRSTWWIWIPVVILVAVFLPAMCSGFGSNPRSDAKSSDRDLISRCWDDQKRPSHDETTKRFLAGHCEQMAEEFRKKYGHAP